MILYIKNSTLQYVLRYVWLKDFLQVEIAVLLYIFLNNVLLIW